MDQDFSFCNTIFPDEFPSAGDLFLDGKILPIGIKKTVSSSSHVQQFIAVPPRTSLDAINSIRHFGKNFTLGRLKQFKNPNKEVDGHQSSINQVSLSPYKGRIASPRLRLPLAAFFQIDDCNQPSSRLKPLYAFLQDEDFNKNSRRFKPLSELLQEKEDRFADLEHECLKNIKKNRSVESKKEMQNLKTFPSLKRSTVSDLAGRDGGNSCHFLKNMQQVAVSEDGHCRELDWQKLEGLQFSSPPAYKKLPLKERNPGFKGNLCSCLLFSP